MKIAAEQSNILFLADSLPRLYPVFFNSFVSILKDCSIDFRLLPFTKDVWARDFMPLQVDENEFVQFKYLPSYLQKSKVDLDSISDVDKICNEIDIHPIKTEIILDGGNIVYFNKKAIITERLYKDNPSQNKNQILNEIKSLLDLDEIIVVPECPGDFTGHVDGMVHFVDSHTVLVNQFVDEPQTFKRKLKEKLKESDLEIIEMPYHPYHNKFNYQANGVYINFLEMLDFIFLPIFGFKEDENALSLMKDVFSNKKIVPVPSNAIASDGGVLNCISWNIKNETYATTFPI